MIGEDLNRLKKLMKYEEHNADHLLVYFKNNDPTLGALVNGSFKLTRKE